MKLDTPMSQHDFEQLTLLANVISIAEILMSREKPKSFRWNQYSALHGRAEGIAKSIDGHLDNVTLDASERFYKDMEVAVGRFLRSNQFKPVGRDKKGRWCKI